MQQLYHSETVLKSTLVYTLADKEKIVESIWKPHLCTGSKSEVRMKVPVPSACPENGCPKEAKPFDSKSVGGRNVVNLAVQSSQDLQNQFLIEKILCGH